MPKDNPILQWKQQAAKRAHAERQQEKGEQASQTAATETLAEERSSKGEFAEILHGLQRGKKGHVS